MHKVAIILTEYRNLDAYGDEYVRVISSITDWAEVSYEDFTLLKAREKTRGDFVVLEQPIDTEMFIKQTVAEQLACIKEQERFAAEKAAKRKAAAEAKRYKRELADRESKMALLKKLQEELSVDESSEK